MPVAQRLLDIGTRRSDYIVRTLAEEIRRARHQHGLSQAAVAAAARISRPQFGRIERGENVAVSVLVLSRVLAVLGMQLNARAFPSGQPIRDVAHRALLEKTRAAIGPRAVWAYEKPVSDRPDDRRAWDAAARIQTVGFGVETETRVSDVQALQRRIRLKVRDDPSIECALLVLAASRHNRSVVRMNAEALAQDFEILTPGDLRAWAPERSGLVLL